MALRRYSEYRRSMYPQKWVIIVLLRDRRRSEDWIINLVFFYAILDITVTPFSQDGTVHVASAVSFTLLFQSSTPNGLLVRHRATSLFLERTQGLYPSAPSQSKTRSCDAQSGFLSVWIVVPNIIQRCFLFDRSRAVQYLR